MNGDLDLSAFRFRLGTFTIYFPPASPVSSAGLDGSAYCLIQVRLGFFLLEPAGGFRPR